MLSVFMVLDGLDRTGDDAMNHLFVNVLTVGCDGMGQKSSGQITVDSLGEVSVIGRQGNSASKTVNG